MKIELGREAVARIEAVYGPTSQHREDTINQIFLDAPLNMASLLEDEDAIRQISFHCTTCGFLLNPGNVWVEHWHPQKRPGDDIIPEAKVFLAAKYQEFCGQSRRLLGGYQPWREQRRQRLVVKAKAKEKETSLAW